MGTLPFTWHGHRYLTSIKRVRYLLLTSDLFYIVAVVSPKRTRIISCVFSLLAMLEVST